ncbi:MAG: hypothetical protein KF762_05515 [Acidobacteria bacterium]|nr:hypothetical protein [Acidobacteriota bacterium]
MKDTDKGLSKEAYDRLAEYVRIGNRAMHRAEEENRQLGLPNVFARNGKLIFEMPDGSIVIKDDPFVTSHGK